MYNTAGEIKLTIYPYKEGFEDKKLDGSVEKNASFKLCPGSSSIFKSKKVKLECHSALLKDKIDNSNNAFDIEGIYNASKTELNDVLGSYQKYIMEKQKSITQTLSAGLVDQLKAYNVPDHLIQRTIDETLQKELEPLRMKLLGVPVDEDGNYVKGEYPFRKFKNDIVDCINEWVEKKKQGLI
jgi:lipid II:glycine glycyltransferase (peptidoglycan interpeptide bridge formation enzyme)